MEEKYHRFKNFYGYLNAVFHYAVRKRYISATPMTYIDKARLCSFCAFTPPLIDSDRVLSHSELDALISACEAHIKRHPEYLPDYAILLAIMTGMRVGELAALKWSCIYDGKIHITLSEHRIDYEDHS